MMISPYLPTTISEDEVRLSKWILPKYQLFYPPCDNSSPDVSQTLTLSYNCFPSRFQKELIFNMAKPNFYDRKLGARPDAQTNRITCTQGFFFLSTLAILTDAQVVRSGGTHIIYHIPPSYILQSFKKSHPIISLELTGCSRTTQSMEYTLSLMGYDSVGIHFNQPASDLDLSLVPFLPSAAS